jgi:lipopolysaccharide export system protein LptC
MSDARSANRLRLLIVMTAVTAMALGSFWVREVMMHGAESAGEAAQRTDPDYFVDNFNFVRASKIGQARYAVAGVRLTHFPKDDTYEITLPVVRSLSADRPSIVASSLRGTSNSDASYVQMFDDVKIDRPKSKFAPDFHLRSDYMQIYPDDDVMKTPRPVDIIQGDAEVTGSDMYANNATLVFTLAHNVHTIVQPRKKN